MEAALDLFPNELTSFPINHVYGEAEKRFWFPSRNLYTYPRTYKDCLHVLYLQILMTNPWKRFSLSL